MKKSIQLFLSMLGLLIVSNAYAAPMMAENFNCDEKLRGLKFEATSLMILDHLKLTNKQRTEIKSILDEIKPALKSVEQEMGDDPFEIIKNRLRVVIAALKAGQSPEKLDDASKAKFSEHTAQVRQHKMKVMLTFEKIMEVLSEEQRKLLHQFNPFSYIGFKPDFKVFRGIKGKSPVEMINYVRKASDDEYKLLKSHLQQGKKGKRAKKGKAYRAEKRQERLTSLITFLDKIRNMNESEFNAQSTELSASLAEMMPRGRGGKGMKRGDKAARRGGRVRHGDRGMTDSDFPEADCQMADCPMGHNPMDDDPMPHMGKKGSKRAGHKSFGGKHFQKMIFFTDEFYNAL